MGTTSVVQVYVLHAEQMLAHTMNGPVVPQATQRLELDFVDLLQASLLPRSLNVTSTNAKKATFGIWMATCTEIGSLLLTLRAMRKGMVNMNRAKVGILLGSETR